MREKGKIARTEKRAGIDRGNRKEGQREEKIEDLRLKERNRRKNKGRERIGMILERKGKTERTE